MAAFDACPDLTVAFSAAGVAHHYPLKLPVVVTGFLEPVALPTAAFVSNWAALAAPAPEPDGPREQQVR